MLLKISENTTKIYLKLYISVKFPINRGVIKYVWNTFIASKSIWWIKKKMFIVSYYRWENIKKLIQLLKNKPILITKVIKQNILLGTL